MCLNSSSYSKRMRHEMFLLKNMETQREVAKQNSKHRKYQIPADKDNSFKYKWMCSMYTRKNKITWKVYFTLTHQQIGYYVQKYLIKKFFVGLLSRLNLVTFDMLEWINKLPTDNPGSNILLSIREKYIYCAHIKIIKITQISSCLELNTNFASF